MPPQIATAVFLLLVGCLFWLDRDAESKTSRGLWLAVFWLCINGSHPVSWWLSLFGLAERPLADASHLSELYLDGSPIDRFASTSLLIIGLWIAASRHKRVGVFLRNNAPILAFVAYCGISVLWSDYSFVAFKRWVKSLSDIVIVLVVLTDHEPFVAMRRLLSRVVFILVPLSVLFVKYYPDLGREYNKWTYVPAYSGVTETKNELGMLCLIFGLGSIWRILAARKVTENSQRRRQMLAHGVIVLMVLWLFYLANSMTSIMCFSLATVVIIAAQMTRMGRKPAVMRFLVAVFVLASAAALFSGGGGAVLSTMGRDPTLTGRTNIWQSVLSVSGNPFTGTGFESFWLGDRLQQIWKMTMPGLQEAHNGYLEVYLNLGFMGLALLLIVIATGYRNSMTQFRYDASTGSLSLAYFAVGVIYSFTEAGFRETTLIWTFFLLASSRFPQTSRPAPEHAVLPSPAEGEAWFDTSYANSPA